MRNLPPAPWENNQPEPYRDRDLRRMDRSERTPELPRSLERELAEKRSAYATLYGNFENRYSNLVPAETVASLDAITEEASATADIRPGDDALLEKLRSDFEWQKEHGLIQFPPSDYSGFDSYIRLCKERLLPDSPALWYGEIPFDVAYTAYAAQQRFCAIVAEKLHMPLNDATRSIFLTLYHRDTACLNYIHEKATIITDGGLNEHYREAAARHYATYGGGDPDIPGNAEQVQEARTDTWIVEHLIFEDRRRLLFDIARATGEASIDITVQAQILDTIAQNRSLKIQLLEVLKDIYRKDGIEAAHGEFTGYLALKTKELLQAERERLEREASEVAQIEEIRRNHAAARDAELEKVRDPKVQAERQKKTYERKGGVEDLRKKLEKKNKGWRKLFYHSAEIVQTLRSKITRTKLLLVAAGSLFLAGGGMYYSDTQKKERHEALLNSDVNKAVWVAEGKFMNRNEAAVGKKISQETAAAKKATDKRLEQQFGITREKLPEESQKLWDRIVENEQWLATTAEKRKQNLIFFKERKEALDKLLDNADSEDEIALIRKSIEDLEAYCKALDLRYENDARQITEIRKDHEHELAAQLLKKTPRAAVNAESPKGKVALDILDELTREEQARKAQEKK